MSKYLTKVVETYRVSNENEVEKFIQELKKDNRFEMAKYSSTKKARKEKGEIVDEWIHFEVTKFFNDEKYPDAEIEIDYTKKGSFWDGPTTEEDMEDEE